jgi:excisionase family DNA binding protein
LKLPKNVKNDYNTINIKREGDHMEFITTSQASKLCGVGRTTIAKWVDAGRIQAYLTPGGHRKINKADLISFMEEQHAVTDRIVKQKTRILIVDDNSDDIELLKAAFMVGGDRYEIHTADGGFQAIYKIGAVKPHVVILDLIMPDMDGFEVCTNIKNSPETNMIKVIAVTAFNDRQKQQKAHECGADAYFTKPLDLRAFVSKILDFSEPE